MGNLNDIRKSWDVPDWIPHMRCRIPSGVYAIGNTVNGKLYIGSAKILYRRKKRNLLALRTGKHHNSNLQREWSDFGESHFYFSIIEFVVDYKSLRDREQYWMDFLEVVKFGYNICPDSKTNRGHVASEETRRKMSVTRTGRVGFRHSEETRRKLSLAHSAYQARKRADDGRRAS